MHVPDIWDPNHVGDIMELEKVQQRAAHWVMNDKSRFSSVTLMLNQLPWPTIQTHHRLCIYRLQTLHKVL